MPQFMGLVQGSQVPGADDNRPAVRVIYQDTQGRMILLDQQRIRPGQTWPSSGLQWAAGEIGLALHGDAPGEVLRNLRAESQVTGAAVESSAPRTCSIRSSAVNGFWTKIGPTLVIPRRRISSLV